VTVSAAGWLIWSNVMIISFFASLLWRLPFMATASVDHDQLVALVNRVNAHVAMTATITQNHATQINTAITTANSALAGAVTPQTSPGTAGTNTDNPGTYSPSAGGATSFTSAWATAVADDINATAAFASDVADELGDTIAYENALGVLYNDMRSALIAAGVLT
jgi:hypothetical protein